MQSLYKVDRTFVAKFVHPHLQLSPGHVSQVPWSPDRKDFSSCFDRHITPGFKMYGHVMGILKCLNAIKSLKDSPASADI